MLQIAFVIMIAVGLSRFMVNFPPWVSVNVPAILVVIFVAYSAIDGTEKLNWKIGKPVYFFFALAYPVFIGLVLLLVGNYLNLFSFTRLEHSAWNQSWVFSTAFPTRILGATMLLCVIGAFFNPGKIKGGDSEKPQRINSKTKLIWKRVRFAPFALFSFVLMAQSYPQHPMRGALLTMPLLTICFSFFLAWIAIESKSFWPILIGLFSFNFMLSFLKVISIPENLLIRDAIEILVTVVLCTPFLIMYNLRISAHE